MAKKIDKMKIAILLYKPITVPPSGYEFPILLMAKIFGKLGHQVKLFAIGKVTTDVCLENKIKEVIIKGEIYPERGFNLLRLKDFLFLYLFGYKPSIRRLNENEDFINKVKEYNPDLIAVSSIQIGKIAQTIKKHLVKTKVIVYTDSYDLIDASFNSIIYTNINKTVKRIIISMLKEKYNKYMLKLYEDLIKLGDVIVTPTEKDKKKISKKFGIRPNKIFVIPPIAIPKVSGTYKKVKRLKIITFIGVAGYGPNIEAVNIIKEKIAPKLKNIKFLIIGKGWKKEKQGNLEILGEIKDLKTISDKTDAFIAPITSGAGMKTKVATYLEYKKPIIGTSVAFEGYKINDKVNGIVEDNLENMYKRISEVVNDEKIISKLQKNSKKLANVFSEENLIKQWREALNNVKQS